MRIRKSKWFASVLAVEMLTVRVDTLAEHLLEEEEKDTGGGWRGVHNIRYSNTDFIGLAVTIVRFG